VKDLLVLRHQLDFCVNGLMCSAFILQLEVILL